MADFNTIVERVLKNEGGLVDDPRDPGGLTNWGISLASYPQLGEDGIRALTKDQAKTIYRADFWDPLLLDHVADQELAYQIMDMGVNAGVGMVTTMVQATINVLGMGPDVAVDGRMGPETLAAVNEAFYRQFLFYAIQGARAGAYSFDAVHNKKRMFLADWLGRVKDPRLTPGEQGGQA